MEKDAHTRPAADRSGGWHTECNSLFFLFLCLSLSLYLSLSCDSELEWMGHNENDDEKKSPSGIVDCGLRITVSTRVMVQQLMQRLQPELDLAP